MNQVVARCSIGIVLAFVALQGCSSAPDEEEAASADTSESVCIANRACHGDRDCCASQQCRYDVRARRPTCQPKPTPALACKTLNESCAPGQSSCCSGLACTGYGGFGTCQPTRTSPPSQCLDLNMACAPGQGATCCEGLVCNSYGGFGTCIPNGTSAGTPPPPYCRGVNETCIPGTGAVCCSGLSCTNAWGGVGTCAKSWY